jgi:hypothetical protein
VGDRLSGQFHFDDEDSKVFRHVGHTAQRRTQGEGGCRAAAPQTPQNRNFKNTDFVDMTSKVLRDLPFSRNQPLKSADDSILEF